MAPTKFANLKVTPLENSEVQITGEIALPFLLECKPEAIKHLNEHASIPGFRSGHIPEDILVKKLGEVRIWEETAEVALGKEYWNLIDEAKVKAIGRPVITITKMVPNEAIEFKINTAVEPEFTLPDYKKVAGEIAKEKSEVEVKDEEVQQVVEELKKRNINPELAEGEKLEDKVKENITREKEMFAKEKKRLKILEALVKETEINIPRVLVESELEKMLGQFKQDVIRTGMKWEDYIKQIDKKEADIKEEWRDKAVDRVKAELIINEIAQKEKIEPIESEVEHEVEHMMSHYPEANPLQLRIYVFSQLRNQKVFEFLEALQ